MDKLPQGLVSVPQGLSILPDELILIIFENILLITDKRQFLKTCLKYNKITKQSFLHFENNFYSKPFYQIKDYSVEKFTLELCSDKYYDMIPNNYITPSNSVIVCVLAMNNCVPLLEIAKNNGCSFQFFNTYARFGEHPEVLKWGKENGYDKF